jgi:hypothetical protein
MLALEHRFRINFKEKYKGLHMQMQQTEKPSTSIKSRFERASETMPMWLSGEH